MQLWRRVENLQGCFLKWWYPTTIGFPTKDDHFEVFWGYHHLRKLVGGWTNPFEKYAHQNWIISQLVGMKIKYIWNHHLVQESRHFGTILRIHWKAPWSSTASLPLKIYGWKMIRRNLLRWWNFGDVKLPGCKFVRNFWLLAIHNRSPKRCTNLLGSQKFLRKFQPPPEAQVKTHMETCAVIFFPPNCNCLSFLPWIFS